MGSNWNQGRLIDTREKRQLGTGSGHLEGLGLHRGDRIGALLGDFFPL